MPRNSSSECLRINLDLIESESMPLLQFDSTSKNPSLADASPKKLVVGRKSTERGSYLAYSTGDAKCLLKEDHSNLVSAFSPRAASMPCVGSFLDNEVPVFSPLLYGQHYRYREGSIRSTALNLASSSLGAGTLALPHAMYTSGLGIGALLLALTCWCTIYSVYLLGWVQQQSELCSIEELVHVFISPLAAKLTAALLFLFCFGAAVMYVVMMGDFVAPIATLLQPFMTLERYQAMVLFWGFIMFPLSLVRDVTSLQYTSIFGTASTVLLAATLFAKMSDTPSEVRYYSTVHFNPNVIGAMATFIFSYCCQPIVITAYREMREKSVRNLTVAASWSMGVCTLIYLVAGMCGAIAYGDRVEPNILINFEAQLNVPYVVLACIAMVCSVTLAFPMAIFPSRSSVLLLSGYSDPSNVPTWLIRVTGGTLSLLALLLGIFLPSVRVLFDVLGGICGGTISFLLPGVLALRCHAQHPLERHQVIMCKILIVLGGSMTLLGCYHTYQSTFLV